MTCTIRSNGKLLLSGEYLILFGATGLAVPLQHGQSLTCRTISGDDLIWQATHTEGIWFSAHYTSDLAIKNATNIQLAEKLKNILIKAIRLKGDPKILSGKEVNTHLEFSPSWGWGSSSTLISNIAQWLNIDPYLLLAQTFGGSGYDIACATAQSPLFFRLKDKNMPVIQETTFTPPFLDQLWVGFLNRKQNSKNAIQQHLKDISKTEKKLERATQIAHQMAIEPLPENFMELMDEHESIISKITGLMPLKQLYFSDFIGTVKSLGAWGGDFFLALSLMSDVATKKYFQSKGFKTIFKFQDIILNQ
ncbi:GYDIA family GHMP kinase [Thermophagus sp. OGC60D27]|uniref:GYDIA family GHMP kinase n=1 Tax=Thermophagus sp. OGC60D27 TaxID=3458415 RepID=UPI004038176A